MQSNYTKCTLLMGMQKGVATFEISFSKVNQISEQLSHSPPVVFTQVKWKLTSRLKLRYIFLATSFIIAKTEKNSKVLELMSEFKTTSNLWLEKAMATHSSMLAWKIPWTEEPGGLQSVGLWRIRHDFTFTFTSHFHTLEKEMATHSSVLAWRIPGMGEPGRVYWVAQSQDTTEAT